MKRKYIGVIFIIIGTLLAVWGYDHYDSAGSQLSRAVGGDMPLEAWIGLLGGALCVLLGILKIK